MTPPPPRVACLLIDTVGAVLSEQDLHAFAEACLRFTPLIAIDPRGAIFLEISRCQNLYTEAALVARLQALVRRLSPGGVGRVGFGPSPYWALTHARFPEHPPDRIPLRSLRDFVAPSDPEDYRDKALPELLTVLHALGLTSLQEFMDLPERSLASRFGALGRLLRSRLAGPEAGGAPEPWPAFHLREPIQESVELDGAEGAWVLELEPLLFILRGLVDRAMARLRGKLERATEVEIRLGLEHWSHVRPEDQVWQDRISLPVPQGSVHGLLPILQDHLAAKLQAKPLVSPAIRIEFTVTDTLPGRGAQRHFFDATEEESEALDALVGRLTQKLGIENVTWALPHESHIPEEAWTEHGTEPKRAITQHILNGMPAKRPLRLFKTPRPAPSRGQRSGLERIQSGWWRQGVTRDYSLLLTPQGLLYWVYQDATGSWVHGAFD